MELYTSIQSFAISIILFIIALVMLLLLAPFLPYQWAYLMRFLAVFPAIWVGYNATLVVRSLDELQQRITLETLSFSLANTALVIFAIGLFQISTQENTNFIWVLIIFAIFGGIGLLIARHRFQ
jgi:hypothetical protein